MVLRLDRFATLYVVNPVRRRIGRNDPSIPILMYHSISDEDETKVRAYYRTATSAAVFARHMNYLHDLGYSTINVPDAVRLLRSGAMANKYVVITFDDGYRDFYTNAFPALDRSGFTATVFLPTGFIGKSSSQFKGKDCLTWGEARELRKYGISFGSHTVTHPQLSILDARVVKDEVVNSKHAIEDNLGESVDSFSYPYAFPEEDTSFVQKLRNILINSGYSQGVSTRIGVAHRGEDEYFLRRLPMNNLDDFVLFRAKMGGGYDWLQIFQYASKRLTMRRYLSGYCSESKPKQS